MRKIIKEKNWLKIGACFGVFICILLMCFALYFTPNFVSYNLSPDGILSQNTILGINLIRLCFAVLSTIGLLVSVLCITKPNMVSQFYSNLDRIRVLKLMLFLSPVMFVICAVLIKLACYGYYKFMVEEDSIIEWLTFLCYFIAFMVSFSISINYYRSKSTLFCLMYMLLSIGLFFIAMEEISWGQRIFNVPTPKFFLNYNYQKEMNIHNFNLFPLHTLYIIVGFYGAFTRFFIPKRVNIKYSSMVDLFVPDYYLFIYFFVVGGIYFYIDYISSIAVTLFGDSFGCGPGHIMIEKDQEPAELLLSCGFLLFVIINKYRLVRNKTRTYTKYSL